MSIALVVDENEVFNSDLWGKTEIIEIPKELTVVEAVPFRDQFKHLCERNSQSRPTRVMLDFSFTSFMDSSGIGALASIIKYAKKQDIDLVVNGLTPQVEAVLTMTGLNRVLKVENTASSAGLSENDISRELPVTHASVRSRTKRAIDIIGALTGLTITGLLFIPLAIAIRRDGPGPLFFSQTRCGWMGSRFKLWKFRSMVLDAEARKGEVANEARGAIFKVHHDPRITRVGHFLRKTSLDELPQFWNVLTGSMSLVGTRPPTVDEIDQYDVPEWRRLDVKPGITGEWQVNGRSTIKDFEDVIRLDLRYQRNWSLIYDFKLLFRTVAVLFSRNNGAM